MISLAESVLNSHRPDTFGEIEDDFFEVPSDESSVIRFYSRSFSMASQCLPKEVRGDVEKLYAWCRWCDEAVDSASNIAIAQTRLSYLRDDVTRIFDGQKVKHPASNWLAALVESRGIRKEDALALLSGMEMDLKSWQVRDEEQLICYCYRVAGVVGLMMCRVMGVDDRTAERHAVDLGIAMQLTNIARDVAEDWKLGRCYLPKSWVDLDSGNPSKLDFSHAPTNEVVRASVERLLRLAEDHYTSGLVGLFYLPRSCRYAISLAAIAYREIGREIMRRDSKVMNGRITISSVRCVWIGVFAHAFALQSYWSNFMNNCFKYPSTSVFGDLVMKDARYLAYLGLSLTSFMASALFAMVAINPKDPSYSALPIIYAVGCIVIGIATNLLARRAAYQPVLATVLSDVKKLSRSSGE